MFELSIEINLFGIKIIFMKSLNHVLGYKNPNVIKKHASENGLPYEEAEKHFEECIKFLYICTLTDQSLSPSKDLDKIWHTFILFTKDYQLFCHNYLGKFIHHVPDAEVTEESKTKNQEAFNYAFILAEATFKNDLYYPVWKPVNKMVIAGDCSEASCGGCTGQDSNCHGCTTE